MTPTIEQIKKEARTRYVLSNPFGGTIHHVSGEKDFIAGAEWVLEQIQKQDAEESKCNHFFVDARDIILKDGSVCVYCNTYIPHKPLTT